MGTDKALLPHHDGDSWLERTLLLLLQLEMPVTLLSRHPQHLRLALALQPATMTASAPAGSSGSAGRSGDLPPRATAGRAAPSSSPQPVDLPPRLTAIAEPEPWEGPLLALQRLMEHYPDQRLLLCPVDMPWLSPEVLRSLLQAADEQPQRIHLAHDGERRQPLLGVYPSGAPLRADLSAAVQRGERRLQSWLAAQDCREVRLEPGALRNVNGPRDLLAPPSDCKQTFADP